jgi:hypothetical protein
VRGIDQTQGPIGFSPGDVPSDSVRVFRADTVNLVDFIRIAPAGTVDMIGGQIKVIGYKDDG